MNEGYYVDCNSARGNMVEPACRLKEGVINKIVMLRPGETFTDEEDVRTYATWMDKINANIESRLFVFPSHQTLEADGGEPNVNESDPGIQNIDSGDTTLNWSITFRSLPPKHIASLEGHNGAEADFIFFDTAGNVHVNVNDDGTVGGFNGIFQTNISSVPIGTTNSATITRISFNNARDFNTRRQIVSNIDSRIRRIDGIANVNINVVSSTTSEIVVFANRFDTTTKISAFVVGDWDIRNSSNTVVDATSSSYDITTGNYTIEAGLTSGSYTIALKPQPAATTKNYESTRPVTFTIT